MDVTQQIIAQDSSWETAMLCAQSCLKVPAILTTLVKNSWSATWEPRELVRSLGFLGFNARCILRAAELPTEGDHLTAQNIEKAVALLGVRGTAVVVAINYACQAILESAPPDRIWMPVFKQMINDIELGYHFGTRADGIGSEGGMLMGFVRNAGVAILMSQYPREYTDLYNRTRGVDNPDLVRQTFGCESYQVGAMAVQQLGFGPEIAIATALAVGNLHHDLLDITQTILTWKAAYQWIQALEQGQAAPRDPTSQACFPDMIPPNPGKPASPALTQLYSQISNVRRRSSAWLWHLPEENYDQTSTTLAARRNGRQKYTTSKGKMVVETRT